VFAKADGPAVIESFRRANAPHRERGSEPAAVQSPTFTKLPTSTEPSAPANLPGKPLIRKHLRDFGKEQTPSYLPHTTDVVRDEVGGPVIFFHRSAITLAGRQPSCWSGSS